MVYDKAFQEVLQRERERRPVWIVGIVKTIFAHERGSVLGVVIGEKDGKLLVSVPGSDHVWARTSSEAFSNRDEAEAFAERKNGEDAESLRRAFRMLQIN